MADRREVVFQQSLCARAKERIRTDPAGAEHHRTSDPQLTSGPPILFYVLRDVIDGSERVLFVGYKYIPETTAVTIIRVDGYPVHKDEPVKYPRRVTYPSR